MPFDIKPVPLQTADLVIRPQTTQDNNSDYAAVMANKDWLRRWSGSPWPEDSFTAAENLADLRMHITEHEAGDALGYSIATPDSGEVLGSLYLQTVGELLDTYAASDDERGATSGYQVRADIWTRLDLDPTLLARAVTAADPWLRGTYNRVLWCSRIDCPELEAAYAKAGLSQLVELKHPDTGRLHRLFGALG